MNLPRTWAYSLSCQASESRCNFVPGESKLVGFNLGVEPKIGVENPPPNPWNFNRVFHEINKPSIFGGKIHPYFWVDTHLEVVGENQYRMENVAMDLPDHFGQPAHFFLRFSIRGALQAAIDKAKKIEKAGRFLEDLLLWRLGRAFRRDT